MAELPLSLEWIGATLRAIQAEQRTLRDENQLMRKQLERMLTRQEMSEILAVIVDRIAGFEKLMETRFDKLEARLGGEPR
jgi:hypothetical protein